VLTRRALVAGTPALLAGCGVVARRDRAASSARPGEVASAVPALSDTQYQWARTAWRYLENNTDYDSGLVNGMDRTPTFTMANAGDAIAATLAAHELKLIAAHEFDLRLSRLLGFLATMDLSQGKLPNKVYNSASGRMVGFENRPDDIGWSAVDIGRALLWLRIAGRRHPRFQEYTDKAVLRWTFCDALDACGALRGMARANGQVHTYQEGRFGYEQLAAAGYAAWGFDARGAATPAIAYANVEGQRLPHDSRDPRTSGAQAPLLTMPFVLSGLEYGWQAADGSSPLRDAARTVYAVQESRWRRERQLTARTDFQLREAPWVVLDSVWASGYAWNTIASDGKEHERLALVSVRAAFGLWALWPTDYTQALIEGVRWLYDADRGWFEGRYEQGGAPNTTITLATNAQVLEALWFKAAGAPLFGTEPAKPGLFEATTGDPFQRLGRCWPGEGRPDGVVCGAKT
jgi:hypothetical protein